MRCRDSRSVKSCRKQGWDDSIKLFSIEHIFPHSRYRVWLYTELFYAIISTLCPCSLLICYIYNYLIAFLKFFSLVYVTF